MLEVHNQGEPIPPAMLPGLFQPFSGAAPTSRDRSGASGWASTS